MAWQQEIIEAAEELPIGERDASGRILASPAWHDLAPADCDEAFERQLVTRRLERALDAEGLTTTARAVLERARWIAQG